MSSTSISAVAAQAMLAGPGLVPALDAYTGPAYVQLFAGTQPAPGGAAGTLVCTINLQKPSGSMSGSALQLAVPTDGAVALVSTAPTWGRVFDGNGTRFMDIKARLSTDTDDPDDPAAIVVLASSVAAGTLLRFSAGSISITG